MQPNIMNEKDLALIELKKLMREKLKFVTIDIEYNDEKPWAYLRLSEEHRLYVENTQVTPSPLLIEFIENFMKTKGYKISFNNSKNIFFFKAY